MYNERMAQLQQEYNNLIAMQQAQQNWANPYNNMAYAQNMQAQGQIQPAQGIQNNQSQQSPDSIRGKLIDDINNVPASDVVMDGKPTIFPTKNYDKIYVKKWNTNGTIDTYLYVPVSQEENKKDDPANLIGNLNDAFSVFVQEVSARFDKIEQYINSLSVPVQNNKVNSNNNKKKEGTINE